MYIVRRVVYSRRVKLGRDEQEEKRKCIGGPGHGGPPTQWVTHRCFRKSLSFSRLQTNNTKPHTRHSYTERVSLRRQWRNQVHRRHSLPLWATDRGVGNSSASSTLAHSTRERERRYRRQNIHRYIQTASLQRQTALMPILFTQVRDPSSNPRNPRVSRPTPHREEEEEAKEGERARGSPLGFPLSLSLVLSRSLSLILTHTPPLCPVSGRRVHLFLLRLRGEHCRQ